MKFAMAGRVGTRAYIEIFDLMDTMRSVRPAGDRYRWAWVVIAGVVAVASGAGMYYCKQHGYDGFTGDWYKVTDAKGDHYGVKIGCYKN